VSLGEGAGLFGLGFLNKAKNLVKSVIKHPLKTGVTVISFGALLSLLPLFGVSSSVGVSALVCLYSAKTLFKTGKDIIETVKNNKNKEYDKTRTNLKTLGADGFDMALSLPFLPKSINNISRYAKYGKDMLGFNSKLFSTLKDVEITSIPMELSKADLNIKYNMMASEMKLPVKPELKFKDLKTSIWDTVGGGYEPAGGTMQVNQNLLTLKGRIIGKFLKMQPEVVLRHELEHFRQFGDIARLKGTEGLKDLITEYYTSIVENGSNIDSLVADGLSKEVLENVLYGDKSLFNEKIYDVIIKSKGMLQEGTSGAQLAEEYAKGFIQKANPDIEDIELINELELKLQNASTNSEKAYAQVELETAFSEIYENNILEKEAYSVQDSFYKENMRLNPDGEVVQLLALNGVNFDDKKSGV